MEPLLKVDNLSVVFHTYAGVVKAVQNVSFDLGKGEIIGIVGESGCGKSVTASTLLRIIPTPPGEITSGSIMFDGTDIVKLPEPEMKKLRGNAISMIFQDPMTSLNPVLTIGLQLAETLMTHQGMSKSQAYEHAVEMLKLVNIPSPETRIYQYPHQLSGGMRQRVMIAMALACNPRILIADEPTTALDVTVQAQIVDLMKKINKQLSTSIILISHDLGLVAGLCQRVIVMYAGRIIESANINDIYSNPQHPYTWGLLQSVPRLDMKKTALASIAGRPPDLLAPPPGCAFKPRCKYAMKICSETPPFVSVSTDHTVRCWLVDENSPHKPECLFKEGLA